MAKKFSDLAGACWKGYKAVGLKDKNGKKVPNCVPEEVQMEAKKDEEETVDRVDRSDYKVSPSGRKSHKQIVFKMGDEEMKESTNLKEATVKTKTYSWGTMKTVHHGADFSIPLHPEHHQAIAKLKDEQEHNFKTEDGKSWTARRKGDEVHFQGANNGGTTKVKHETMAESVPAKNTDIADKSYLKDMGKKPTIKSDLKNFKNFLTGKKETNEEVKPPFDGPYTKTKPAKNSDGTMQSPMSRARALAQKAMKQKMKEEFGLDITDEQADSLLEASYAPVAPVPDKKYIKGTPEHKAYKATKKPINGMPTNVKEDLDESVFADKDQAQSIADKLKKKNEDGNYSVVADHGKHRIVHAYHSASKVKKDIARLTEEVLDEANHREFASQGKMHPDMAKHMTTGQEMDYYEHGTGDKVSGKVLKNDGKEVHIKQTHDSYDPKKRGTVHKFKISDKLDEKAPPGFEGTVKAMKKHKEIDNPFALAWYMKNKGMKSHKEEFDDNGELITNMKSYKEFLESLDEVKMSDLPSRKVSGKYGTEYYKGEAEKDVKGYDDEDTPAKPAGEKRGRGRPAGSTSGARQKGTIAKRKGSGVETTGYPLHLPNFK
jgi:hypothetical protein